MTKHYVNITLLVTGLTSSYFLCPDQFSLLVCIFLILLVFLAVLLFGVFNIQFNYFLQSKNKLKGNKVLLTFDDGPEPERTLAIVEILNKHEAGAVFFMIGKKMQEHPGVVEQVRQSGFPIGNHSYEHANSFPAKSTREVQSELEQTEMLLGEHSYALFRPPIGITNPNIARAIKKLNLKSIGWSIRSLDTINKDDERMFGGILRKMRPGSIVLFHDNSAMDLKKFDAFIAKAKSNGIIFAKNEEIISELNA